MSEQSTAMSWETANHQYLVATIALVRAMLERHAERDNPDGGGEQRVEQARAVCAALRECMPAPAMLDRLAESLGLSQFERDLLVMCAAVEYDGAFAQLCARAHGDAGRNAGDGGGDVQRGYPTFSLALAALDGAYWEALSPEAPLRHWRLIQVGNGASLASSPLRIDEWVLHYLTGIDYIDERLAGMVTSVAAADDLVGSHREAAQRIAATWARTPDGSDRFPVMQLCGAELGDKRAVAAAAAAMLEMDLCAVDAYTLPAIPSEVDAIVRLWERYAILNDSILLVELDDVDPVQESAREASASRLIESVAGLVMVSTRQRRRQRERPMLTMDIEKPTTQEQWAVWQSALGVAGAEMQNEIAVIVSQFNLSLPAIRAVYAGARGRLAMAPQQQPVGPAEVGRAIWDTCRSIARPRLDDLAQRIDPGSGWDDLVLPATEKAVLRDLALHVRNRATVYEIWGFAGRGRRGLGISALFAGASGTGKTMAAEVLSSELRLDLYRIDLSAVVSKYIGETEKNLARIFDAAEEGGAILLFDEADALFGKRSEVKDSHDRHANIEVSYLLQRMEAYRGLAILTTNHKQALDTAFLRRIRFIVQFPFPDLEHRAEIWRRVFPRATPTDGLDAAKLGRLNVAGGNIRNIALNAAFMAAEGGEPVRMKHLLAAAQKEYTKLEKPLNETEIRGWV